MSAARASFPRGLPLLLAFDLDGTLIRDGGTELPPATAQALARLRSLGVKLAIITGRDTPPRSVREGVQADATATNNGGRIEAGGELHAQAEFSLEDVQAVLAHELQGARLVLFTPEAIYVDLPPGREPEPWMVARGYHPLSEAPQTGIVKAGFYHPEVATLARRLRKTRPHLVVTGGQEPYPHFLTVTPTGAHKAAALTRIAELLEVPLERTVAFGDSDNDEVMLETAGYAVQVGTLPLLARHADEQVADHEALAAYLNGVADGLERL
ncbi:HAD-IIB family hydrolase [Deinococcus radiodurans]|uniref:HAD-IIB family hydrolase n=1 Tax=Deinococcus radiodurans TaxID=1299 RepID=UPI0005566060|nr:HAD family hydrolase [Deinococcus radiodurans]ANC70792.1 hydrolase [Deinococcus radiodurans R1 = ATCC 13939 = DSM 20539]QEM71533.1 HAD family phosphatase [Deinococcus radiodurans]QIP27853.1 HAD family phosphatase [Deinococcus radiodurans]UDL01178.1 HAD family phosphatase [Deinococcus radiodurans R1 = ATCC 13939 = DSM 20539]